MGTRKYTVLIILVLAPLLPAMAVLQACVPPPPTQSTDFTFRTPTGLTTAPVVRTSTLTVPGLDVFATIDDYEAAVVPVITNALLSIPEVTSIRSLSYSYQYPRFKISGEQTTIVALAAGLAYADLSVTYRHPDSLIRAVCGSAARVDARINDLAATARYDFFTGGQLDLELDYSSLNATFDCNLPIIGEIAELINDLFDIVDVEEELTLALEDLEGFAEESINGRFANFASLEDVLANLEETGPQDIREYTEDVMRLLGGLSSAVAAFIADEITDELVQRLSLQTEAELDQLRDLLSGLEEFIAENVPGLTGMTPTELAALDLSDYLTPRLPGIQQFLLDRLSAYYANAAAAVANLETLAIDAVEQFVGADFGKLFGGLNLEIRLNRVLESIVVDAYHTAPATFIGTAHAVAPCLQDYTIADTENVTEYSIYSASGDLLYRGLERRHLSVGFLHAVTVENYFGLHSYQTNGEVELEGLEEVPDFMWPTCPDPTIIDTGGGGAGGSAGSGGTGGTGGSAGTGGGGGTGGSGGTAGIGGFGGTDCGDPMDIFCP